MPPSNPTAAAQSCKAYVQVEIGVFRLSKDSFRYHNIHTSFDASPSTAIVDVLLRAAE